MQVQTLMKRGTSKPQETNRRDAGEKPATRRFARLITSTETTREKRKKKEISPHSLPVSEGTRK
jgi:type IV secretory pathway TrbF-like protein